MATLKELVDEHGFGVKFTAYHNTETWFKPMYLYAGEYIGIKSHEDEGSITNYVVRTGDPSPWELYVGSKKKVKKYIISDSNGKDILTAEGYYEDSNLRYLMVDGKPVYIEVEE